MRVITKRGQFNQKVIFGIIISLIVVVVFLQVYESIVPTAQAAGDSLGDAATCANDGFFFNETQSACLTNSSTTATTASFKSIPLSGLFSGDGVVFVIIMAAALLVIVVGFLRGRKE